jgi:hypothetical protein
VALFYPLVDVATWLRLAALRKDAGVERNGDDRHDMLSGVFAMQAVESTLMGLVACAVGAIAAAALGPSRAETAHAFAMRLAAPDNAIVAIAAALIAICVVSAAVTTITAILAASLVTLRYDLAASGSRDLPQAGTGRASETALRRRTLVAAIAMTVAAVALGAVVAWTSGCRLRERQASGIALRDLHCADRARAPRIGDGSSVARAAITARSARVGRSQCSVRALAALSRRSLVTLRRVPRIGCGRRRRSVWCRGFCSTRSAAQHRARRVNAASAIAARDRPRRIGGPFAPRSCVQARAGKPRMLHREQVVTRGDAGAARVDDRRGWVLSNRRGEVRAQLGSRLEVTVGLSCCRYTGD